MTSHTSGRIFAVLIFAAFLAPLALPGAAAQLGGAANAAAAATSQARSVGTFDVTPVRGAAGEGQAIGSVVSTIVAEGGAGASGSGVLRNFAIARGTGAGSGAIFESIDVTGFTPTSKLQGVGTSALSLKSESLAISMTDTANSLLVMRATGSTEQEVVFKAAAGVIISASGAASNVWNVAGNGVTGALVLVSSEGQKSSSGGSTLALNGQDEARATLKQGGQLVFRTNTDYATGAAGGAEAAVSQFNQVALGAVATGRLASEATSEFSTGASLIASAHYFVSASAKTETAAAKRVVTTLRSEVKASACAAGSAAGSGAGSATGAAPGAAGSATGSADATANANVCAQIMAYDLDYVDVPAQTAEQVAVYIDGELATRVAAAADTMTHADAYWATTVEGRVLVLTNVAAKAGAATQVTIAALAQGEAAFNTLAELDAATGIATELQGSFSLLGNLATSTQGAGQVAGTFATFFASEAEGAAETRDFTDIRSATSIFTRMHFAADAAANAQAAFTSEAKAEAAGAVSGSGRATTANAIHMATSVNGQLVANTEFTDSVYSTIEAEAEATTVAQFDLANDVRARAIAENMLLLEGPAGPVGYMILTKAEGGATTSSHFDVASSQKVRAALQAQEKVVFRSASNAQARAGADIIAQAIAKGDLAGEASAGFVANAMTSTNVEYASNIHMAIDQAAAATHRGIVTMDVVGSADAEAQATAVALVTDRAILTARAADDVVVTVAGKAAVAASSSAEVFAAAQAAASATASAKYFVLANLDGQTLVITSLPNVVAGQVTKIEVISTADAQARLNAALDIFGGFSPGYGGAATGSIVSLIAKADAGLIIDYTVNARSNAEAAEGTATTVFDAVKLGSSAFAGTSSSSMSSVKFTNREGYVEAFDVSGGVLKVVADATTSARFDLASNVEASSLTDNVVMLSAPDFTGAIILVQGASQGASFDTSATGVVTAHLVSGSSAVFKAFSGFEAELTKAEQEAHAKAIASGKLLGQVVVNTDAMTSITSTANVNYYESTVASIAVAQPDKLQVLVDSATSAGKVIVLSLDRNTVTGLISGDAKLLVDGKEISQAASYEDVLKADADKYWIITTDAEAGLQAIVSLSHFSTRTITLETPPGPSIFLWSTVGLGLVVVGQAIYPRLRRKW